MESYARNIDTSSAKLSIFGWLVGEIMANSERRISSIRKNNIGGTDEETNITNEKAGSNPGLIILEAII